MENQNLQNIEQVKKIGCFTLKMNTEFDKEESDFIFLKVGVSDDFAELLQQAVIPETTGFYLNDREDQELTRYKVKRWVYSSIYGDRAKDLLFLKELVDKKKAKIGFERVQEIERVIQELKEVAREFIHTMYKYKNLDVSVSYDIKEEVQ